MVLSGKYESGEKIIWANERFAVPEILFNPSDIGIQETEILSYSIQNKSNAVLFFKKHCLTGGKSGLFSQDLVRSSMVQSNRF